MTAVARSPWLRSRNWASSPRAKARSLQDKAVSRVETRSPGLKVRGWHSSTKVRVYPTKAFFPASEVRGWHSLAELGTGSAFLQHAGLFRGAQPDEAINGVRRAMGRGVIVPDLQFAQQT